MKKTYRVILCKKCARAFSTANTKMLRCPFCEYRFPLIPRSMIYRPPNVLKVGTYAVCKEMLDLWNEGKV